MAVWDNSVEVDGWEHVCHDVAVLDALDPSLGRDETCPLGQWLQWRFTDSEEDDDDPEEYAECINCVSGTYSDIEISQAEDCKACPANFDAFHPGQDACDTR
jgi:hypothetical protein